MAKICVVPLDRESGFKALHFLSAWGPMNLLCGGQPNDGDRREGATVFLAFGLVFKILGDGCPFPVVVSFVMYLAGGSAGSHRTGWPTQSMLCAGATEHRLVLAHSKVQDKSNEITAIPALLELFEIIGCIVTLDAMGTQKTIAAQIKPSQADYILCLKANHPILFQEIDTWFQATHAARTLPLPSEHTTESGHHRVELRSCWAISLNQLPPLHQSESWVGLRPIVIVERTRHREQRDEVGFRKKAGGALSGAGGAGGEKNVHIDSLSKQFSSTTPA